MFFPFDKGRRGLRAPSALHRVEAMPSDPPWSGAPSTPHGSYGREGSGKVVEDNAILTIKKVRIWSKDSQCVRGGVPGFQRHRPAWWVPSRTKSGLSRRRRQVRKHLYIMQVIRFIRSSPPNFRRQTISLGTGSSVVQGDSCVNVLFSVATSRHHKDGQRISRQTPGIVLV